MTEVEMVPPPAVSGGDGKLDKSVLLIAGVVVVGAIMSILDVTVVNIANPTFQAQWHIAATLTAWTMTGYTLALATVIPITGWAADRFGTKRLYMTALVLFVLGSLLCATAGNIYQLIGYRVLQGLGGGMLMPLGMTIMTRAAGADRLGRLMAVLGIPMLLGPIGGPILGGWLIKIASWHWIFLINLPIGIGALIYAYLVLPKDVESKAQKFDFLGMALLSPGLAAFLFGVTSIPGEGKVMAVKVLVPAAIGIALIIAFVLHALTSENPLIDLRLFKDRSVTVAAGTMFFFACAFFGASMLLPMLFQQIRGEDTFHSGLMMIPNGLGAMLTMPVAGRMVDKMGPGKIVLVGLGLIVAGMGTLTQIGVNTSFWVLAAGLLVMGMGQGCTMMPVMTAALATLRDAQIARGSTLMNIINQVGSSAGTAIAAVVLVNNTKVQQYAGMTLRWNMMSPGDKARFPGPHPTQSMLDIGLNNAAHAYGHTFIVSVCLVACCFIPAAFLPRRKTAHVVSDEPVLVH